ncbi:transposase, partial [Dietzia sp. 111N12-1]|uniref:transposase n=1 Tax=Dietzia sp. 111N12-1 TaxID=1785156 RepID=UPI00352EF4BC
GHPGRQTHARGGDGNHCNGSSRKTVATEVGPVEIDQPRDRQGSFVSQLVPKGARHALIPDGNAKNRSNRAATGKISGSANGGSVRFEAGRETGIAEWQTT